MGQFFTQEGLNTISIGLVLVALLYAGIAWLNSWAERIDEQFRLDNPLDTDPAPDHFQPRAEHIKRVLADLESLRTPLKDYKLPRAGADPYVPHVTDVRMP